jgi:hypothetical protein
MFKECQLDSLPNEEHYVTACLLRLARHKRIGLRAVKSGRKNTLPCSAGPRLPIHAKSGRERGPLAAAPSKPGV